jgi:hypothetical protein
LRSEKAEQSFQFLFRLCQGFPTIFTGFGSEVEVKDLVAACTNANIYITIQAYYKVTVDSKCIGFPRITKL